MQMWAWPSLDRPLLDDGLPDRAVAHEPAVVTAKLVHLATAYSLTSLALGLGSFLVLVLF
jgi:hypothetical protein